MKKSLFAIVLALFAACNGFRSIKTVFTKVAPYDHYVESLQKADLTNASMAREWLSAGEEALRDSVFVNVPFSESGFFQASDPQARSYRFQARDGQVLTVKGAAKSQRDARMFMDLFTLDDDKWERVDYGDSTLTITHEFSSNEECILRLQPELLANAWYSIHISLTPVLINPVYGASNKAIGSFYGAPRDNGKRTHEGVDIFATKGTPVIAPTEGYITRVGNTGLGGKVVWMRDMKRRHSYYFAHLDSQMVHPGMHVRQGHVLGLVGNTGNAKRTPPHLHFGIYQYGSKDPLYYIRMVEAAVESLPIDTGFHQKPFKTRPKKANLMSGPSSRLAVRATMEKDTYVTVIGQSYDWYRISLPDKTEGYILKKDLTDLENGTPARIDSTAVLLSESHPDAVPVAVLHENTNVEVLARFGNYTFVVTAQGKAGWLPLRFTA